MEFNPKPNCKRAMRTSVLFWVLSVVGGLVLSACAGTAVQSDKISSAPAVTNDPNTADSLPVDQDKTQSDNNQPAKPDSQPASPDAVQPQEEPVVPEQPHVPSQPAQPPQPAPTPANPKPDASADEPFVSPANPALSTSVLQELQRYPAQNFTAGQA